MASVPVELVSQVNQQFLYSILFLSFFALSLLPAMFDITFAGKPYFLGPILFVISLLLNDRNKFLSLIFIFLFHSVRYLMAN